MLSTQLNLSTVYTGLGQISAALHLAEVVVERAEPIPGDDFAVVALHNLAVAQLCSPDPKVRKTGIDTLKRALRLGIEMIGEDADLVKVIEAKLEKYHRQKKMQEQETTVMVRAPAPPNTPGGPNSSQHRSAASRALRALDFATPEEDPLLRKKVAERQAASMSPAPNSAMSRPRAEVMSGATFVDGPAVPPTDGKHPPLTATEPQQQQQLSPQLHSTGRSSGTSPVEAVLPPPTTATNSSVGSPREGELGSEPRTSIAARPPSVPGSEGTQGEERLLKANASSTSITSTAASATGRVVEKGRRTVTERSFMRFAADLQTVPPPLPITFREVKAEANIKRSDPAARNEVAPRSTEDQQAREHVSVFKQRMKEKAKRQELEEQQEKILAEKHRKLAEEAAIKAREEARLEKAHQLRGRIAVRTIWRAWSDYRMTHPRQGRRKHRTVEQELYVAKCRKYRRFANRWLNRTAAQRLIARLTDPHSRRRLDYQTVLNAVRCVQRSWRCYSGKLQRARLTQLRLAEKDAVRSFERRYFATVAIQQWFRNFLAHRKMGIQRSTQYTGHILVIQRWGRKMLHHKKNLLSVLSDSRRRQFAATRIQAAWRGHTSRLTVAVLRLKRKIARMRQREQKAAMTMQRVGRGLNHRRGLGKWRVEKKLEALKLPPSAIQASEDVIRQGTSSQMLLDLKNSNKYRRFDGRQEEMKGVEVRDRDLYLEMVVSEEAKNVADRYSHNHSVRKVEIAVAHERFRRQEELTQLRAERAAKAIQRRFRRWIRSMNDDRRNRLQYYRAELQYQHYLSKEKALEEQIRREKLRLENDNAKTAREEREALRAEIEEEQDLLAESEPMYMRDAPEREEAARQLRQMESELHYAMRKDGDWLRSEYENSGVRTFRTVKEKRREDEARRRAMKVRMEDEPVAAAQPQQLPPLPSS